MSRRKRTDELSFDDQYLLGYMEGYRIGQLNVSRDYLIRCLHMKGKEKNITPCKTLIKKINREIDNDFLFELLFYILKETISLEELEICYDRIFMIPSEDGKELKIIDIPNKSGE